MLLLLLLLNAAANTKLTPLSNCFIIIDIAHYLYGTIEFVAIASLSSYKHTHIHAILVMTFAAQMVIIWNNSVDNNACFELKMAYIETG